VVKEKSAAVFAVRRANYTHRRKGVFNVRSIEDLNVGGNVRYRTRRIPKTHQTMSNKSYFSPANFFITFIMANLICCAKIQSFPAYRTLLSCSGECFSSPLICFIRDGYGNLITINTPINVDDN
jgi:hypothetical protein